MTAGQHQHQDDEQAAVDDLRERQVDVARGLGDEHRRWRPRPKMVAAPPMTRAARNSMDLVMVNELASTKGVLMTDRAGDAGRGH
jgi:hypothetical protein